MMRNLSSDLKLGFVALLLTFAVAFVMLYIWFVGHDLSRTFIGEAQKISATLPILAVTEGQVAEWTNELRKTESFKGEMDSHLAEQINKIRLGEYTADQLNEHLASCKKFCGPLLGKIFEANMRDSLTWTSTKWLPSTREKWPSSPEGTAVRHFTSWVGPVLLAVTFIIRTFQRGESGKSKPYSRGALYLNNKSSRLGWDMRLPS
jgi:hypothetical protein